MLKYFLTQKTYAPSTHRQGRRERWPYSLNGQEVVLVVTRTVRTKRMTLRVDLRENALKISAPMHTEHDAILNFVAKYQGWAQQQFSRHRPLVLEVGTVLPIKGTDHRLCHSGKLRGTPQILAQTDTMPALVLSGEQQAMPRRVAQFLKQEAERFITPKAHALASSASIEKPIRSIAFKDTSSRWGSCSAQGALSFSWRIIMAPEFVIDYLIAHEVAHLQEMNHKPQFWALCETLCPKTQAAKAWLKAHGAGLQAISFR